LTAERFIRHPFCNDPGARLYRTGDLARYGPDGNIQFLGRRDHQVKIRGFRVELGEIEWALRQHSAVGQAAVVVREDERGEKRLVAYVSVVSEPAPTRRQLREHLRSKLPGYMLPSAYVLLEALPLTPNGKVDRRALPEPEWSQPELERVHIPPRNAVEETVAGIWGEVLKVHRVGVEDNFFELGGHSLLATQVISRVRDALQIKLPLRTIFATPTVEGLAAAIDQAKRIGDEVREPAISHLPREPQQIERKGLGARAPRLE
jgi:acyl carrier protein